MTDIKILRGGRIKAGDTSPKLRLKLLEDGNPFNLSGYSVNIVARRSDGEPVLVNSTMTIEHDIRGIVTYDWSSGETDESGTYEMEVTATNGSDSITFPNSGTARLYIEERLA
jgi:hypothetical protein